MGTVASAQADQVQDEHAQAYDQAHYGGDSQHSHQPADALSDLFGHLLRLLGHRIVVRRVPLTLRWAYAENAPEAKHELCPKGGSTLWSPLRTKLRTTQLLSAPAVRNADIVQELQDGSDGRSQVG